MVKKQIMNKTKLFWIFWFATTIYTGILCGFMISHSLILGRYFSWSVATGHSLSNFTAFRNSSDYPIYYGLYYSFLYIHLLLGVIWTILTFLSKRERIEKIIAIVAGLSSLWVGLIFSISDIDEAEEAVMSGTADASMKALFVAINVPAHTSFAIIYFIGFFLLLVIAYRNLEFKNLDS
ncbi:MAG: hypothetical protein ACFFCM_19120 [Promethearchaeota archaeon]